MMVVLGFRMMDVEDEIDRFDGEVTDADFSSEVRLRLAQQRADLSSCVDEMVIDEDELFEKVVKFLCPVAFELIQELGIDTIYQG